MGVNIYVEESDGEQHDAWDHFRCAGDREFAALVTKLPTLSERVGEVPDFDWRHRPAPDAFGQWRAAIVTMRVEYDLEETNVGRWENLIDLLERRPDLWINLSY